MISPFQVTGPVRGAQDRLPVPTVDSLVAELDERGARVGRCSSAPSTSIVGLRKSRQLLLQ
jgi:hypothetical protein